MKLSVATCYLPVDADIDRNRRYVLLQMRAASERGARVAHFPEGCLSGYAGVDFSSFDGFDWPLLEESMRQVLDLARSLRIWVILGSSHRLRGTHKPHNSVYVISDRGKIVDRYDKMFCGGDEAGTYNDLARYSPGDHFTSFDLDGVRCGVLICYDYGFPELYREYKRRGVQLMFHSYHAGHASVAMVRQMLSEVGPENVARNRAPNGPAIRMQAAAQAAAHANHMWISASNTSARKSCFASFFVRVDGVITGRLARNRAGVLVSTIDTKKKPADPAAPWRERALNGIFHSGRLVRDARSRDRQCY